MTSLHWPPFPDGDARLAVVAALLLIGLGAAFGLVVGAEDRGAAAAAEAHYGRSVVNTTYSAVAEQAQAGVIPPWLAFGLFIAVILGTNLATTAIAAYAHRFYSMPLAVGVTSFLLAYSGFVPAMIGVRFAGQYGLPAVIAALAPHGGLEIAAMTLAGAAGLLAATTPSDAARERVAAVYWRRVAPLLVVAAVIECTVTPVLMYIVMR